MFSFAHIFKNMSLIQVHALNHQKKYEVVDYPVLPSWAITKYM